MRYFCRVEYDGTKFGGWQRQTTAISIQEILEEKAAIILKSKVQFTGAGRTDAGVHARAQGAHFDFEDEIDISLFTKSMNAILPPEIAIYQVTPVPGTFHARFSALKRRYSYYLAYRKLPLFYKRAWMIKGRVNWDRIREEIKYLEGEHDFSSFCASGSDSEKKGCHVFSVAFEKKPGYFVFSIEADRFLYKMVRSIVGTLIDIGRGKLSLSIGDIIEKKDRRWGGTTAPAWGLVLENVIYSEVE